MVWSILDSLDMNTTPIYVSTAIMLSFAVMLLILSIGEKGVYNLPPGPPRMLLSGQGVVSSVPLWKRFHELHARFGPVISTYQGRTVVIVLGTIKAATDLLEKRGGIYSSRPRNIMAGEILSGGMRGLGMPYGTRWRNWRSLMHAGMGIEASQSYKPLQSIESKILLRELLMEALPTGYRAHLERYASSIAFCIGYGRRIQYIDDPLVVANQKVEECYIKYSTQGLHIVEAWPILLKLPRFLQWFRSAPEEQRKLDTQLFMSLMNEVREQMKKGLAQPSIAKRGLEKQSDFGLSDLETAYALSAPFTAGVTTTTAVLDVFFLAMLHYPDAMRKAQREIDSFVGSTRMPSFEDANSLPYVNALIRETMRWRPIAPLGVPHSITTDDIYESWFIPKGSTVVANLYTMSKDPEAFPSPEKFSPERYLESGPQSAFYFGFGRRICPGMHVAQNSLFIIISRILWAYDIMPVCDIQGSPVLPPVDAFMGGLVTRPPPFPYVLKARSDEIRDLILCGAKEAEVEASAWM